MSPSISGECRLYDIRTKKPLLVKRTHNEMPIKRVQYLSSSLMIGDADEEEDITALCSKSLCSSGVRIFLRAYCRRWHRAAGRHNGRALAEVLARERRSTGDEHRARCAGASVFRSVDALGVRT